MDAFTDSPESRFERDGIEMPDYWAQAEARRQQSKAEAPLEAEAKPCLPLLWFDEIEPVLEAKDFVQGLLSEGAAGVVYGESNAGKTFWTTDLALHVAAGKEWHGRRVDQGGVVYCALEGGNGFRNRVAAWRREQGEAVASLPFAAVPTSLNLLDPNADTPKLIQTIQAAAKMIGQPVKLVVIDTLSRAMAGGNENAPNDMGALVGNMDAIRQATGAFVLFIHHCGKDAAKGARGHSSLRAAIDTEIEVTADEASGLKTATVVKQREMQKGTAFGFRLDTVILGQNEHGEDVTTCVVAPLLAVAATRPDRRKALTTEEQGWLKDINDLFAEPGIATEGVLPRPEMLPVWGATRDQIRAWLQVRGRVGVAPGVALTATERSTLGRYLNRLKDKGKLGIHGNWVWLL